MATATGTATKGRGEKELEEQEKSSSSSSDSNTFTNFRHKNLCKLKNAPFHLYKPEPMFLLAELLLLLHRLLLMLFSFFLAQHVEFMVGKMQMRNARKKTDFCRARTEETKS